MRCWADADRGHTPVLALPVDGRLVKPWLFGRILTLSAGTGMPFKEMAGHHLVRFWTVVDGGEAFGREWLVGLRFPGISLRRGSFLLDLGEQPGPDRDGC